MVVALGISEEAKRLVIPHLQVVARSVGHKRSSGKGHADPEKGKHCNILSRGRGKTGFNEGDGDRSQGRKSKDSYWGGVPR